MTKKEREVIEELRRTLNEYRHAFQQAHEGDAAMQHCFCTLADQCATDMAQASSKLYLLAYGKG